MPLPPEDRSGEPLPLELGPASSDEYDPPPVSPVVAEAARRARDTAADHARRRGMTRRAFLRSSAGMATVLFTLGACTREEARSRPTPATPGGTFRVTPEATIDPDVATETFAAPDRIIDVQGHLLEYDLTAPRTSFWGDQFPQARCDADDPRACFSIERFLELYFLESETTAVVLSAVPIAPGPDHPLSPEVMAQARELADRVCGPGRLALQGQVNPTVGPLEAQLAAMADLASQQQVVAWKVYTHTAGAPWRLDDADPAAPQVGQALIDRAREVGVPRIAVHKGFSGRDPWSSPEDIGAAAVANPDVDFVVYHSGYEPAVVEGPYDPAAPGGGIDRLLATLDAHDIPPGANVYAELGSTWFNVLRDADQAAHTLGKLTARLGPDNVVWGTDSIWYGSPQGQIDAFRTFDISAELQERHGYPALDDDLKTRILAGNAARLYGLDPPADDCTFTRDDIAAIRRAS
ncbi:MAG: amidohydrolase family protein [Actinobacteria bacterium]|nr:amidohydrolase family protein [Actinomycetota bacterium]